MNILKILEALEEAKKNNVPHGKHFYRNGDTYCVVGYMVKHTGVDSENIGLAYIEVDSFVELMEGSYGLTLEEVNDVIEINDLKFLSWDDTINYFKGLQDEHSENH